MCDQYYYTGIQQYQKFQQDPKGQVHDGNQLAPNMNQNGKLYEMEEQLELAENRCNTLKDQLDQMKKVYQSKATPKSSSGRSPNLSARRFTDSNKRQKTTAAARACRDFDCSGDKNTNEKLSTPALVTRSVDERVYHPASSPGVANVVKDAPVKDVSNMLVRQNSQAISTDTSGAAVQTINNILNGITDSVNRLSQLHVKLEYEKPSGSSRKSKRTKDSACGNDQPELAPELDPDADNSEEHEQRLLVDVRKESIVSLQSKSNVSRRKSRRKSAKPQLQRSTISVNITSKRSVKSTAKHIEKKFKMEPVKMIKYDSASILTPKLKKPTSAKRVRAWSRESRPKNPKLSTGDPERLVEIYHNVAAKASDSDDSCKCVVKQKSGAGRLISNSEMVPSYTLEENCSDIDQKMPRIKSQQIQHRIFNANPMLVQHVEQPQAMHCQRQLSPIHENTYSEPVPNIQRMDYYGNMVACSKNYELPTIASKMKQVAKSYLRHFNLNAIPFCPAKSTSPSHNIGINIQQVMNILKNRQPISGISPTLAHNIGLAAEKLHNRSLSAMASSLTSRAGSMRYDRMMCPMNRHCLNYQQLQEMAKEIPEEPNEDEHMETGASGDTNRFLKWTTDPSKQKTCTCMPQKGIDFQQVYSKYTGSICSTNTIVQPTMHNRFRYGKQPWRSRTRDWATKVEKVPLPIESKPSSVLKGKEKSLKDVLTNLHNEFANLNAEYENLSNKISEMGNDADDEILKQLEHMEKCLNNKEEEITMVMTLYREVVSLKQQIKVLKRKASVASIAITNSQQPQILQQPQLPPQVHPQICHPHMQQSVNRVRDYNEPHAAIHLTKLLRQIQVYQEVNRIGHRS